MYQFIFPLIVALGFGWVEISQLKDIGQYFRGSIKECTQYTQYCRLFGSIVTCVKDEPEELPSSASGVSCTVNQ